MSLIIFVTLWMTILKQNIQLRIFSISAFMNFNCITCLQQKCRNEPFSGSSQPISWLNSFLVGVSFKPFKKMIYKGIFLYIPVKHMKAICA